MATAVDCLLETERSLLQQPLAGPCLDIMARKHNGVSQVMVSCRVGV